MKIALQPSGGDLLKGKARDVGALASMFDGDAQDASVFVHVKHRVLIQVAWGASGQYHQSAGSENRI